MKIFYLPDLGEGLTEAEIREWFVKEGDTIQADQPMVSMETAKAIVEVPAPRTGKVIKLHGKPGDIINTGAPLVEFEDGEQAEAGTVAGSLEVSNQVMEDIASSARSEKKSNAVKALPAVRTLAKKLNVDLATVTPSGANGQITAEDVENATKGSAPLGYEPLHGVRRTMAIGMAKAHAEVVPVTLMDEAYLNNGSEDTDITLKIIEAIIKACKIEPSLNAWFDGKTLSRRIWNEIHLGLAMDSNEGLFVPVLKNVHQMSPKIMRETINRYKEEVKNRSISPENMQGATFVLSNFGTFAGRHATPIVGPPTVAILGTGRLFDQPALSNNQWITQKALPLSLTIDHRAITGGEASRFLAAVIESL